MYRHLVCQYRPGDGDKLRDGGRLVVAFHRRLIAEAFERREETRIVCRLVDVVVQRVGLVAPRALDHVEQGTLHGIGVARLGADDGGDGHHDGILYADTPMNSLTTVASARRSGVTSWVMRPFWMMSTRRERARMKSRFCSTSTTVRP